MEKTQDKIFTYNIKRILNKEKVFHAFCKILMYLILFSVWFLLSTYYNNELLLPSPIKVIEAFFTNITSSEVISNLLLTLKRVLEGFLYALIIGLPLGFIIGYFKIAEKLIGGFIDSIRQVPIMAWVPLTIVWFGIGDGPTIFLIAFSGVFPIILNTVAAVKNIPKDYYNAARSMGASKKSILLNIIIPATIPDILTGSRIAISSGWMSVIWAEFIATSAGLGYSMVEAQTKMQTDSLVSLMFLAAFVGFFIDRALSTLNKSLTKWKVIG